MLEKYLRDSKRFDIVILAILSILVLVTRLPFTSKYLFEWDSVNFALGFENYNIIWHQPQPPGYILYVGLGRVLNMLFHDANATMIFISIVSSILTVILVYFLAKQLFSRKIAVIASIILIFNPIFWFYGEVATIYPCEAFLATLIVYLSYNVLKGNDKYLYPAVAVLGIAGGFREDLIIFMLPLVLFCLLYPNRSPKRIIKAFLVLVISILIWFVPTILLAGGLNSFILANGHFGDSFHNTSSLFGASISMQLLMDLCLFAWLILGFGIIGGLLTLIFIIFNRKNILDQKFLMNPKFIVLALWIIPYLIFQILVPLSKPGYILTYVSAISLILGFIFNYFSIHLTKLKLSSKSILVLLISAYVLISSIYFIYPYDLHSEITWETSIDNMNQTQEITLGLDMLFMYNYKKIHINDENMQLHLDTIKNISKPGKGVIIIRDILREDEGFSWRKAMYYLPDYDVYSMMDNEDSQYKSVKVTGSNVQWSYAKNHNPNENNNKLMFYITNNLEIPINSSTEKIIWIMSNKTEFFNEVKSKNTLNTISLPNGLKIYYSNVQS